MTQLRIRDAATYLGVSDDTVRRLVDGGTFARATDDAGRAVIDGRELARYAKERSSAVPEPGGTVQSSARNRFVGIVTDVIADRVMAQVELQCGPHRVVSLMSAEAVHELEIEVGSVAVAVIKATMVVIEKESL